MKQIKKFMALILCFVMFALLGGCDEYNYSTTKSLNHHYSLGEIAEVIYNDEKPEFVFRFEYVTYEEKDFEEFGYYGVYTLGYNHTSYRSDFDFKIDDERNVHFSIIEHDEKEKTLTVAAEEVYPDLLYLEVICPNYISLTIPFKIKLDDSNIYNDSSLDDHINQLEKKYAQKLLDQEAARLKEVRRTTSISLALSFIVVLFIISAIVFIPTKTRKDFRDRYSDLMSTDVNSPDFKNRKPCKTSRGLGIFSFVLSLLAFIPVLFFLALEEKVTFLPAFICFSTFCTGITSYILRCVLHEKHGLDIAGIIISLFPLLASFSFLF